MSIAGAVASEAGGVGTVDSGGPGGPPMGVFDDDGPPSNVNATQEAASFIRNRQGGNAAPRQQQRNSGSPAPERNGSQPAPQQETEEDDDPTAKAYDAPDEDDADTGPAAAAAATDDGTVVPVADPALSTFAKVFGLTNPGDVTTANRDAIVSRVNAALAAGSQPGNQPGQQPAGPQAASPPASQQSAAAPAASADLAPLTAEELAGLNEFGPQVKSLGERFNKLAAALSKPATASPDVEALKAQLATVDQTLQREVTWGRVQPWVASFCDGLAKKGLPSVPVHEQRGLAEKAQRFQFIEANVDPQTGRPRGTVLTDDQAMQAVYMATYGTKVQAAAATARADGQKDVVRKLERKTRRFDLAGGPGAIGGTQRTPSDDDTILQASRDWRKQQNQQR